MALRFTKLWTTCSMISEWVPAEFSCNFAVFRGVKLREFLLPLVLTRDAKNRHILDAIWTVEIYFECFRLSNTMFWIFSTDGKEKKCFTFILSRCGRTIISLVYEETEVVISGVPFNIINQVWKLIQEKCAVLCWTFVEQTSQLCLRCLLLQAEPVRCGGNELWYKCANVLTTLGQALCLFRVSYADAFCWLTRGIAYKHWVVWTGSNCDWWVLSKMFHPWSHGCSEVFREFIYGPFSGGWTRGGWRAWWSRKINTIGKIIGDMHNKL